MYIKKGAKMDGTYRQVLRKGCCAQKIDLQRKKEEGENQQICVIRRRGECVKTTHTANHLWKLSKRQAEKKRIKNFSVSYPCYL